MTLVGAIRATQIAGGVPGELAKPVGVCDNLANTQYILLTNQALTSQVPPCPAPLDEFSMLALFSMFWRIATFRMGPADVPASPALLPTMVCVFLVVNISVGMWLASLSVLVALASSVVILLVWLVFLYGLVSFKGVRERFLQTTVALLGVDSVITLLNVIPGGLSLLLPPESAVTDMLRIVFVGLFFWDMLAKGAIYRDALNLGPMQANLLAMCFSFGFTMLDISLFSPVTTP